MAESKRASTASKAEHYTFKVDELVWGKVKGFNFWPGELISGEGCETGRKKSTPFCVRFFGAGNYAWLAEDSIRPYAQFRDKYGANKKAAFRSALKMADAKLAEITGKPVEPLNVSSVSLASAATPQAESKSTSATPVFSAAKAKKTVNSASSTPMQRDYSRTPFKSGRKPAFDPEDKPDTPTKREVSPVKAAADTTKRVKITEPSPSAKRVRIESPIKSPKVNNDFKDDFLSIEGPSSSSFVEQRQQSELLSKPLRKSATSVRPSNLKFGFIGLGNMGQQVLRNLLQAGHEISIWNRTPSKCKEFEKSGASVMKTPGDVIRESDITFSCLSDAEASSKIFFGNCGVSQEINASKGYVELTSMDPTTSIDIEETIKKRGGRYLEAPLINSIPKQIDQGELVAMAAGDRSLFDDCSSCFETICSHVYFLSEEAGTAAKMNLVIATLHGNILGALMESTSLADRLGLLPKDLVEIITNSPFSSALVESKSKSIIDSTLIKDIPFGHILRDLKYTLELSNKHNYSTPITAITNEVFKQKQHHYF